MESTDRTVERELAQRVIAQVAPEELVLFRAVEEAYRRNPAKVVAGAGSGDELLGFGVETVAVLLSPVVLASVTEVSRYLAGEVVSAIGVASWLRRRLRSTAGSDDNSTAGSDDNSTDASPPLTAEQLDRVRDIVRDRCEQAGVAKARARLVADAVVGALTDES